MAGVVEWYGSLHFQSVRQLHSGLQGIAENKTGGIARRLDIFGVGKLVNHLLVIVVRVCTIDLFL